LGALRQARAGGRTFAGGVDRHVEPKTATDEDGTIAVEVRQVIRDAAIGEVVADQTVSTSTSYATA
jgi:hypothetical protein